MKRLIVFLVAAFVLSATGIPKPPPGNDSKPTLLVGFFGGVNFSQPFSLNSFQVIDYLGTSPDITGKSYSGFLKNIGNQFGFVMFYPVKGNLHVGLLPSFNTYNYQYKTHQVWQDAANNSSIEAERTNRQKLRYIEIPLVIRYYIGTANLKPFVEGYASYGLLQNAQKSVISDFTQYSGNVAIPVQHSEMSGDYSSSYITSKIDLGAGGGVSYDFDQLIVTLGVSYSFNMNNIVNEKGRFDNQTFSGSQYDVQDNIRLPALKINLAIIFPISKITRRGAVDCHYFKEKRK